MEIRGVRVPKIAKHKNQSGFFVMRPPEFYSVPLLAAFGEKPIRVVKVGSLVREGTLLAKPNGKYGSYVYSPTAGKVVGIVKKLNVCGAECEHVVISRTLEDIEPERLPVLDEAEHTQEILLKRLYESGMVDNFEPFDPAYKKYILKCPIKKLVINCTEDEPYLTSDTALLETYRAEVFQGAKLLKKVAGAEELIFIFTLRQWRLAEDFKKYLKSINEHKLIKIKTYPNVYPLHYSRLIGYYESGKMVAEGVRTATTKVIVDSVSNCYDFYQAVNGKPAIQKAVTVGGNNCLRKANYFIKNGTNIRHVLEVVGTRQDTPENMLIYGGIMSGIAQETLDISVSLNASEILFVSREEYSTERETPCINCGKCVAVCPVRLHVKNIDEAVCESNLSLTKKLGVETCLGCGACSFVCPAKRDLAQRVAFAKDIIEGKRLKSPSSAEYELIEGEDAGGQMVYEPEHTAKTGTVPDIDDMLKTLDAQQPVSQTISQPKVEPAIKTEAKVEPAIKPQPRVEPAIKPQPKIEPAIKPQPKVEPAIPRNSDENYANRLSGGKKDGE